MKQFNLAKYLKNPERKVVTRDGRKVTRFLCINAKGEYPIVVLVENSSGSEAPVSYTKNGEYMIGYKYGEDLFFAPEKHEGWANIYGKFLAGSIFSTKEEAEEYVKRVGTKDFVATAKIEWEE